MNQPKLYSKYHDMQKNDNIYVLDNYLRLCKWKKEGETVLDIGSGDGKFVVEILLPRLPKHFGKFVGCDNSEEMVSFAKEKYKTGKIDFFQFDISSESLPSHLENRYNHIFSFYTLHWVEKQRLAFKNIFKLLQPGGDILITFLASNPIYDVYRKMSHDKKWKAYTKEEYIGPYHDSKEPEMELEKVLRETGFVSIVCRVEKRTYSFPDFENFQKSVAAVNPIIPKLKTDDVSNYINDFMEVVRKLECATIENENNNDETTFRIQYTLFIVFATKPLTK